MRILLLLLLLVSHVTFSQDTMYVFQTKSHRYELSEEITNRIRSKNNGVIIVSNPMFDSVYFEKITSYRKEHGLPKFLHSVRLDTLAHKQLHFMHYHDEPVHYRFIEEMQPYKDLLQCENIQYSQRLTEDDNLKDPFFQDLAMKNVNDIDGWFIKWKTSPGHNRNLLSDLQVASLKSSVRIVYKNGHIVRILIYIVLEIDYEISTRETIARTKLSAEERLKTKKPKQ